MLVREPYVAGYFYPSDKEKLVETIETCFKDNEIGPGKLPDRENLGKMKRPCAIVVPHAGYTYSGKIAAHSYLWAFEKGKPDLIVLIGPNHNGGSPDWDKGDRSRGFVSTVFPSGEWKTPLGNSKVDATTAQNLSYMWKYCELDVESHATEHSLEVQLPFLQYIYDFDVPILPITLIDQSKYLVNDLSNALREVTKGLSVLYVASSDFTHYEPQDYAVETDSRIIEYILKNDMDNFYKEIVYGASVCGFGAIGVVMKLGLRKRNLLKYATSGDVTKDYRRVVGYASISFE
jgi:AmmeMemoRadiSam system protein B